MLTIKRILPLFLAMMILVATTGCESTGGTRTKTGAAIGAVTGAVAGAALGAHKGDTNEMIAGAAIGALAGGAVGGGIGYYLDKQAEKYDQIQGVEVAQVPATTETNGGYYEEPEPEHLQLSINNEMLFAQGSSALTVQGSAKVAEIAAIMREYPDTTVIVKGYASSEGDDAYNMALSKRRAEVVANTLVANRVSAYRIQAVGMGESNPVASNATETGRMQNRRVEIEVFPSGEVR